MTTLSDANSRRLAEAWLGVDPDPVTRGEIEELLAGSDDALAERFTGHLEFGTAGLRGALGAGPQRMNRVLVRVVANAIGSVLLDDTAKLVDTARPRVAIGFDARHGSRDFANDTARVLAARGIGCLVFPEVVPTPVLAFTVKHLGLSAGVMVTASHNPRLDNGYKVYWAGGAQIASPVDDEIAARIAESELLSDRDLASSDDDSIETIDASAVDAYLDAVVGLLDPAGPRTASVAYTPLHGVGAATLGPAFDKAGFAPPAIVAAQREPDPDFPTAAFPNPEETGALDLLLSLAAESGADVALANDPDADRLAVAVPNGPSWRLLTGDELGVLLAEYLLRKSADVGPKRLVATTIVSSSLLAEVAAHHGVTFARTLTGFKWIMQAATRHPDHQPILGYEEALGYSIGSVVNDKDGISAALVVAEMVSELKADGRTLLDLLDEIHLRHRVFVTGQRAIKFEATSSDPPEMEAAMERLRTSPPAQLGSVEVTTATDLASGSDDLPPTNGVILGFDGGRVTVRPSGTEPKMKLYGEVVVPVEADDLVAARGRARARLAEVLGAAVAIAASPEPRTTPATLAIVDEPSARDRAQALFAQPTIGAARAERLRTVVSCIDLTTLEGDDTLGRVRTLCSTARRPDPADPTVGPVAAVCVYPSLVGQAAELLAGSAVGVASVAGAFPSGLSPLSVRLADISAAVAAGATEIDIVLNRSAFLDGRLDQVAEELVAAREAAEDCSLKVILEVGDLASLSDVAVATRLALDAGANFVKTSTGKTTRNATPESVLTMAETIAEHAATTGQAVGLKVSGGVRTADDALGYVNIMGEVLGTDWLTPARFRFGASSLLASVVDDLALTEAGLRHS